RMRERIRRFFRPTFRRPVPRRRAAMAPLLFACLERSRSFTEVVLYARPATATSGGPGRKFTESPGRFRGITPRRPRIAQSRTDGPTDTSSTRWCARRDCPFVRTGIYFLFYLWYRDRRAVAGTGRG